MQTTRRQLCLPEDPEPRSGHRVLSIANRRARDSLFVRLRAESHSHIWSAQRGGGPAQQFRRPVDLTTSTPANPASCCRDRRCAWFSSAPREFAEHALRSAPIYKFATTLRQSCTFSFGRQKARDPFRNLLLGNGSCGSEVDGRAQCVQPTRNRLLIIGK